MTSASEPRRIVDEQAEDEGLWFEAVTAPEAYLQQELRRLHAAVEAAATDSSATPADARWEPAQHDVFALSQALDHADQDWNAAELVIGILAEHGYAIAVDAVERDRWLARFRSTPAGPTDG